MIAPTIRFLSTYGALSNEFNYAVILCFHWFLALFLRFPGSGHHGRVTAFLLFQPSLMPALAVIITADRIKRIGSHDFWNCNNVGQAGLDKFPWDLTANPFNAKLIVSSFTDCLSFCFFFWAADAIA